MPLRHEIHQLILAGFREHGIDMPFPPFQMRLETLDGRKTGRTLTSAARTRRRKFVILSLPIGRGQSLCHFCYTGRRATTVMLINPHCQQREEDRSANHPQRAVPVICLNNGLNDGKMLANATTSTTTVVASSVAARVLKITNGRSRSCFALKNGNAVVRNRYGSVIDTFAIRVSLL